MSVEQMLKSALGDPDAAALAARNQVEKSNAYVMSRLEELTALVQKIEASTDEDEIEELEEEAVELAEALEIQFVYTRADGTVRTYSPEAWWEPSGSCEWVESAQYGYDYGWNI